MNDELATLEQTALSVARAPEMILDEAHDAAKALKRVIESKPNKVMFGGEQYLEFEDWQTVGRFYGIAPRIVSTRYVEYGNAQGWEATAEAVHVPTQRVVSSADAMCLNDEEKWSARPKYAYVYHKKSGGTSVEDPGPAELIWEKQGDGKSRPKKERMLIGTEQVPQFQLRSMAQTRAGAKALRNALAWVVVLAGYRPTPAEEMTGQSDGGRDTGPAVGENTPPPTPHATARSTQPERGAGRGFAEPQEPTSTETIEAKADSLFNTDPAVPVTITSRDVLLGKISACQDMQKAKGVDRASAWKRYVGDYDEKSAPIPKLQAFLAQLQSVTAAPK